MDTICQRIISKEKITFTTVFTYNTVLQKGLIPLCEGRVPTLLSAGVYALGKKFYKTLNTSRIDILVQHKLRFTYLIIFFISSTSYLL